MSITISPTECSYQTSYTMEASSLLVTDFPTIKIRRTRVFVSVYACVCMGVFMCVTSFLYYVYLYVCVCVYVCVYQSGSVHQWLFNRSLTHELRRPHPTVILYICVVFYVKCMCGGTVPQRHPVSRRFSGMMCSESIACGVIKNWLQGLYLNFK